MRQELLLCIPAWIKDGINGNERLTPGFEETHPSRRYAASVVKLDLENTRERANLSIKALRAVWCIYSYSN